MGTKRIKFRPPKLKELKGGVDDPALALQKRTQLFEALANIWKGLIWLITLPFVLLWNFFNSKFLHGLTGSTVGVFLKVAMPYIILFIIIFGLVLAFTLPSSGISIFHPSKQKWIPHNIAVAVTNIVSSPNNIQKIPRDVVEEGRCDEEREHMIDGIGSGPKLCVATSPPKDITWQFTTDDIPELNQVNLKVRKIITDDEKKLIVKIPHKFVNGKYVPDCKSAVFGNGESAAYLFNESKETYDGNTPSCELKVHTNTPYGSI